MNPVVWVGWHNPRCGRNGGGMPRSCEWLWVCGAATYKECQAKLERLTPKTGHHAIMLRGGHPADYGISAKARNLTGKVPDKRRLSICVVCGQKQRTLGKYDRCKACRRGQS